MNQIVWADVFWWGAVAHTYENWPVTFERQASFDPLWPQTKWCPCFLVGIFYCLTSKSYSPSPVLMLCDVRHGPAWWRPKGTSSVLQRHCSLLRNYPTDWWCRLAENAEEEEFSEVYWKFSALICNPCSLHTDMSCDWCLSIRPLVRFEFAYDLKCYTCTHIFHVTHIKGFQPEWYISTIYHCRDIPF